MDAENELKRKKEEIDAAISEYLPREKGFQKTLFEACNYSVINGGKRLRPILMQSAYELVRGIGSGTKKTSEGIPSMPQDRTGDEDQPISQERTEDDKQTLLLDEVGDRGHEVSPDEYRDILFPFMAAMEMIHSSSLVHDDLPCMDNDTLRRGKESTWFRFGEDMGTLAGDGLMIYAFETCLKSQAPDDLKTRAIEILSRKSGIFGMIGGQTLDVELTGKIPTKKELEFIYKHKTSALIEASLMIGATLAGAKDEDVITLERAGTYIGLAFQIEDDILDVESTASELGKTIGSDARQGKLTWLSLYGRDQAEKDVNTFTKKALELIGSIAGDSFLLDLVRYLVGRRS